jgi:hypothetical protein
VVTLSAKTGYAFYGVAEDSFTYTDASVTNAADSGEVTITFPATDATVTARDLTGLVTAPVKGATPVTTAIATDQYTGSIAWQTTGGASHTGAFAGSTVYQAVVTLSAKTGYTFYGVGVNGFTHDGAASLTNNANSGTVTITFPPTTTEFTIGDPSVTLYLDGAPLAHNGSTLITAGAGSFFTVGIADPGPGAVITWYLAGTEAAARRGVTSFKIQKTTGSYPVTVEVTPQGGVKQSGAHTFVVQ